MEIQWWLSGIPFIISMIVGIIFKTRAEKMTPEQAVKELPGVYFTSGVLLVWLFTIILMGLITSL